MADNSFDTEVKEKIVSFVNKRNGFFSYIAEMLLLPIRLFLEYTLPSDLKDSLFHSTNKSIMIINDMAQWTSSLLSIIRSFWKFQYDPVGIRDFKNIPLDVCDQIAKQHISSSKWIALSEGLILGLGGFLTIRTDISKLMTLNFRMISQIAVTYGYDTAGINEKIYMLTILNLASATTPKEKLEIMRNMDLLAKKKLIEGEIDESSFKVFNKMKIEEITGNTGRRLANRKLAQLIPLFGTFVSAITNYNFTIENAVAAEMAYCKRRLDEKYAYGDDDDEFHLKKVSMP